MIEAQLETVKSLLSADSVAAFFDTLNARADDFEEMSESFDVIDDFYRNLSAPSSMKRPESCHSSAPASAT